MGLGMDEIFKLLSYGDQGWGDELLSGLFITVSLFLATLPFGLVLGFLVALAKRSNNRAIKVLVNIYTTIFRGVPELLTLFIIFYGGQILLQWLVELFSTEIRVDVSAFFAGMVALGFVFSSYASEAFLSAMNAVPPGQGEAARALGMSRFRTMQKVTFPQIIRHALPGISNLSLILQKDTALVSILALDELLRNTQLAVGATKQPILFFSVACGFYLLLAFLSSVFIHRVEIWAGRGQERT
jgi:polar amino acid transport system permease protein